jgi:hypothetical protein
VAIAQSRGVVPRSIVFPRNQFNPEYVDVLREAGIVCYRKNPSGRTGPRFLRGRGLRWWERGTRLLDSYVPLSRTGGTAWSAIDQKNGLFAVPSSLFLRPYDPRVRRLEGLRLSRIEGMLQKAAMERKILHLWWHPHNFGANTNENLRFLRSVLEAFAECRKAQRMQSLTMSEVADLAAGSTRTLGTLK